ncbi:hypothetical protein [Lactiplantibacillus plantarum]|uniref:hypothetical protein n=1 Tax=Lactiplantibacillus plantarum TaxID=1590 RepID=UPI000930D778|nr:hypothetical protein [Lactiplantibacillus plantarum]
MAIWSNDRKLALSGWLKRYDYKSFDTPLKLQKFLFFYEGMSKADGDKYDFDKLKGYKNGPVFSQVWGDYTKERTNFENAIEQVEKKQEDYVNKKRAELIGFFIETCTPDELSRITHHMNVWESKKARILLGEKQVALEDSDFSENDINMMKTIKNVYPHEMIRNSKIIEIGKNSFIFSKDDAKKLSPGQIDTLQALAKNENLDNPVYVEVSGERLLVD